MSNQQQSNVDSDKCVQTATASSAATGLAAEDAVAFARYSQCWSDACGWFKCWP